MIWLDIKLRLCNQVVLCIYTCFFFPSVSVFFFWVCVGPLDCKGGAWYGGHWCIWAIRVEANRHKLNTHTRTHNIYIYTEHHSIVRAELDMVATDSFEQFVLRYRATKKIICNRYIHRGPLACTGGAWYGDHWFIWAIRGTAQGQ